MVMIDIYTDKLAETSSPPQFPKITDKACRISSETDDGSVDVNNKCMMAIDLSPSRQTDVYVTFRTRSNNSLMAAHLQRQARKQAE
jgi:hypothetical protein